MFTVVTTLNPEHMNVRTLPPAGRPELYEP
jgi:hypothetical protein